MAVFPLLADEEKQLVLIRIPLFRNEPGTAQGVAEIIEAQRIHRPGEEGARIESVVANKFEQGPVELLRAALRNDVDQRAGAAAEFSAVAGGEDLDFGNRIRAGVDRRIGISAVVHILGAVHAEQDRVGADTVDTLARG